MYKIFLTIGKIGVDLTPWVILLEFDLSKTLDITLDSYRIHIEMFSISIDQRTVMADI